MWNLLCLLALAGSALAADPYCPRYPHSVRTELAESIEIDAAFQASARKNPPIVIRAAESSNIIDQLLFRKMAADGVNPAPATTDSEFLRRIYLHLIGRIPTPDQARAFLESSDANKRVLLIEELLQSPSYADQFATFFANRYKVTRVHENIGSPARDLFFDYLRDLMARDRRYDEFVREFLSAQGEVDSVPGTQFFARWMDIAGPIQDSWDDITDKITTSFLGYKTECVSCHNGRAHLEKINLHLAKRTRLDFWKMSAFLSRTQFVRWSDDPIGFRPRVIVADRDYGTYSGSVPVNNPGNRPARQGAIVTPEYFQGAAKPRTGEYRQELAHLITRDRQFARATVNYFWDYFFGYGIVDPPDAWDLDRVRAGVTLPGDWPVQNSHPELLEQLTDSFIASGYSLKALIRLIVTSNAYQLSSRYSAAWKPAYVKYFARHHARRLTAEQMYDSMGVATNTVQPVSLSSAARVVRYANQFPDPTEPSTDFRIVDFLNQLGRGNWMTIDRTSEPTLFGLLFQMNDGQNVFRSMGIVSANASPHNRVHLIDANASSDEDAIRQIYIATLTRNPTDQELELILARKSGPRFQWLSDLQWALLQKLDFTFNY
ncbi:MAG: DUF1553 domain-containing protein [Acidobacteria bacterium]|nr:DUF1553 domain-containing protein [Acidobacteriota bacterium]